MQVDRCGLPITAPDATAVERYDAGVGALLQFADDIVERWEATLVDDPGFPMGLIGSAYLACLSSEGPDAAEARALLEGVDARGLHERERLHLGAARAYAAGDLAGAAERLVDLSDQHPRDALAVAVGHQLDFLRGDALGLRDRVARVLPAWDRTDAWYGYLEGMHAFGLEECNQYPEAEAAGRRALEADPGDSWALHAVVHVHEMQGRVEEGLRFLDERRDDWTTGNFMVVHNSWHEALFLLELGDIDGVLAIYDAVLHHARSTGVAMEMLDAAALLWRLHLDGVDVGERWDPLADAWAQKVDHEWYTFNDAHAIMSFVGSGRLDTARELVGRLRRLAQEPDGGDGAHVRTNLAMVREVGLPVAEALVAHGEGRHDDVVALLHPIRRSMHRFGGSHAQRDAFARTLLDAAIRSGQLDRARAMVAERSALRPTSPYNRRQLARIDRDSAAASA